MNENLNLVEILKDCPKGTKLYSLIHGYVEFSQILDGRSQVIEVISITNSGKRYTEHYTFRGKLHSVYNNDECILFPSQTQRDWSKFTAPWYKKEKFDPKTLHTYDRVLARDTENSTWRGTLFSHYNKNNGIFYPFNTVGGAFGLCIPYNEDTKHLVGTDDEAPEYYRYWED